MPIENFKIKEPLQQKVEKRIASLINDGIIAGIEPDRKRYQIFFCMAIQFVPKFSKQRFYFGKPEGLRVFVSSERKVAAAIDFVFHKEGVKFSHIYQGYRLDQLVKTIKKLRGDYARSAVKAHIELIQFFYSRSQFMLIKVGRNRSFYRSTGSRLTQITLPQLRNEIESILKDPPMFEN
jgi:hypothetical protein